MLYIILHIIGIELSEIAIYAIYIFLSYIAIVVIAYTCLILVSKNRDNKQK